MYNNNYLKLVRTEIQNFVVKKYGKIKYNTCLMQKILSLIQFTLTKYINKIKELALCRSLGNANE